MRDECGTCIICESSGTGPVGPNSGFSAVESISKLLIDVEIGLLVIRNSDGSDTTHDQPRNKPVKSSNSWGFAQVGRSRRIFCCQFASDALHPDLAQRLGLGH